ncbi:hypothetical protein J6590_040697 [Homalodisca vitripennis]|nr:hypothetical protein J6590_040697 [Homalodisca vitripennis]
MEASCTRVFEVILLFQVHKVPYLQLDRLSLLRIGTVSCWERRMMTVHPIRKRQYDSSRFTPLRSDETVGCGERRMMTVHLIRKRPYDSSRFTP